MMSITQNWKPEKVPELVVSIALGTFRHQDTSAPGHFGALNYSAEVSGQFGTGVEVSYEHLGICTAHLGKCAAQLAKCGRTWSNAARFVNWSDAQRIWPNAHIGQMRLTLIL